MSGDERRKRGGGVLLHDGESPPLTEALTKGRQREGGRGGGESAAEDLGGNVELFFFLSVKQLFGLYNKWHGM